ncbi:hypothetical protein HDU79_010492 [Rhizoclosmatium sp. JEL0117]|nr:hypothetical protein HDU79_010492 [Rhizoclosmatium sp. JEL0117]
MSTTTSKRVPYRLVNVFCPTASRLQGNALCVFEDGTGLTSDEMQGLALQFNLSETTFLFPPSTKHASKRARIFTPGTELPFAGHPTLGSSFVTSKLDGTCTALETGAGIIPVSNSGDVWSLKANKATFSPLSIPATTFAPLFSLTPEDFTSQIPYTTVNVGIPQLMLQLTSTEALFRVTPPTTSAMDSLNSDGILLFVMNGNSITSRFFFRDTYAVFEDPGTGSACANLGRLLQREGFRGRFDLVQGHVLKRVCEVGILVEEDNVEVSGRVVEIGRGVIDL